MAAAAPTPNLAPLLSGAAVVLGVGASALRLPGAVVALAVLAFAAWMSVAPPLTGRKDAAGYPTVGNQGEEDALLRHRMWSSLRWRLVLPSPDWLFNHPSELRSVSARAERVAQVLPGRLRGLVPIARATVFVGWLILPGTFVSYGALGAAAVTLTLPVDALDAWAIAPGTGSWLMWPNAIAAYVIVKQVAAARGRFAAISDPRPSVRVAAVVDAARRRGRHLFTLVAGAIAVAAVTVTGVLVVLYGLDLAWLIFPAPAAAIGTGLLAASMFLRSQALPEAREAWENTVAARAGWATAWQTLKIEPPPYLLTHERLGAAGEPQVQVDTFEAPATLGAVGALALLPKVTPTRGPGMRVSILNEPDVDGQGMPLPGTKHPLRFTVVTWPVDVSVDVASPDTDGELLKVLVRTAAAANTGGWPQPMLIDFTPVFVTGAEQDGESDGDRSTAAYRTVWAAPDVDTTELMPSVASGAGPFMSTEAIADKAAGGVMYFGALTTGTTVFADEDLEARFAVLRREAEWDLRWERALKMGELRPWIQSNVYKSSSLSTGQVIECQPFMTPQGVPSESYITVDKELRLPSTLANAPFVSIIGWPQPGTRQGERHPGAFRVLWSSSPIPSNPALITPGGAGPAGEATKWALSAAINKGFDSARLSRPELISSVALTSRQSKQHIWDLALRLYGGVTLAAVKASAEKIRQGMGAVEWLRITGHAEGARIVVGASPQATDVLFARPRSKDITTALDWEQVFVDAKLISPIDSAAPKLVSASTLETNNQVDDVVFTIPRGLAITDFQEPKAIDRMRVNARKVFVDVRHTDDADTFRLLACEADPMPMPAPFMWDVMGTKDERATSFGTNVEGAPVTWRIDLDSHLLVLGSNGSGKGIAATSMLTDMLMTGWDVYAADPIKGFNDFDFADPWLRLRATTYPTTVAIVRKFIQLLDERKELNSRYGVSNIKDLPDDVRPRVTCLFVDEFTSLVIPDVVPKLSESPTEQDVKKHAESLGINAAKASIGSGIGRILREGRATGLVLVLMGQKLTADELKYIPGGKTIKSQMSRLAMGKMNFGDMMSAFNDAAGAMGLLGPAVPRGRGIFESTAQAAFAVQTWWAGGTQTDHFRVMTDRIADCRPPLADDERFDPAPFLPAAVEVGPVFGSRIGDMGDEVNGAGVVDLGVVEVTFDVTDFEDDPVDSGTANKGTASAGTATEMEYELDAATPTKTRAYFVGPGAFSEDPEFIDVEELRPGRVVTGSPAVDVILGWVAAHPGVREVVWRSPLIDVVDDIGLTHGELAESALRDAGVQTVHLEWEQPNSDSDDADASEPPPPVQSAAGPLDDVFDTESIAPVRITDDLFD